MADPAIMGATSPDGISFLVSGSPINPVSESAQQATTIQSALSNRTLYSYTWANDAARIGQGGMREGDTAYQQDKDQPFWYLGSTYGWCPVLIGHPAYGGGRSISSQVDITPVGAVPSFVGHADITFPVGFFNTTPSIQVAVFSANPLNVGTSYTLATPAGVRIMLGRTDGGFTTTVTWQASQ